ncbi:hypothetical protein KOR42_48140 [Thalassoglobus neptunius]|uniref:Uncharacterized protein n=1 Tax=Thalassoglobus neptunius TaxID=1938619 RepID=A0A5C5VV28_9PLAN|nr:hypothetical protein [Thalassoglobus neptunius]TWT41461.1 hypothetical protein KOR42_48140 [Thalassoglobus neptunius]
MSKASTVRIDDLTRRVQRLEQLESEREVELQAIKKERQRLKTDLERIQSQTCE